MRSVRSASKPYFLLTAVLLAGVLLSLATFVALRRIEDQNARSAFHLVAQERFDAVEINLRRNLDNLTVLTGFFEAVRYVYRRQFSGVANRLLDSDSTVRGLGWIPRLPERLRLEFERSARREGLSEFR